MVTHPDQRNQADSQPVRSANRTDDVADYCDEYATVGQPHVQTGRARPGAGPSASALPLLLMIAVGIGIAGLVTVQQAGEPEVPAPLKEFIRRHFVVLLQADFQSGSDGWIAPPEPKPPVRFAAAADWHHANGLLRPGALRVWEPSMALSDYRLDFAGSITRKAMNWTYRTVDANNYYAGRLAIIRPGPLPEVHLIRFAMVDGKELHRLVTRLPFNVRDGSVYKVSVNVDGANMSTVVNGVMADAWSDQRFTSGGIGFYADKDESALLHYVRITRRDNFLGRIFAYFGLLHPVNYSLVLTNDPMCQPSINFHGASPSV